MEPSEITINPNSKQLLNLFSLCIFGVGIIIGAGIYAILGAAVSHAGSSLWISFVLASMVAIFSGISYCELATLYPKAGAEYVYLKKAYPENQWPSFLLGFVLIIAGCATATTVAVGFGGYLQEFVEIPKILSALILMILVTVINLIGIQSSSKVNILFTLIEVLGLFIVIWFGFTTDKPIITPNFKITAGTFSAASLIFFVYLGFEDIANLAEETQNPQKNIPRAILICLTVTTILYIAVAIAVIQLATSETLSKSVVPLAAALTHAAPKWVKVLSSIALFSTANTVLITMLAVSRMVLGISRGGDLPRILAKTFRDNKIPLNASIFTLIFTAFFLLISGLEELANVSSLCALFGFLAVNWAVIVLRYKNPNLERPFRSPVNIGKFPVIAGFGCLSVLVLLTQFKIKIYLIALVIILLGVIYNFIKRRIT
ncbi:MAG: amino acid permease [Bacteriovorax sp.]|nr:amino acid permease [Bacteriovorax sp.]